MDWYDATAGREGAGGGGTAKVEPTAYGQRHGEHVGTTATHTTQAPSMQAGNDAARSNPINMTAKNHRGFKPQKIPSSPPLNNIPARVVMRRKTHLSQFFKRGCSDSTVLLDCQQLLD